MTGRIRDSRGWRSAFGVLLLLVLAIRVAIPTGFMPTRAADGIVLRICTGTGVATAFLPLDKQDQHDRHAGDESPCAFAAGLGGGFLAEMPAAPEIRIALAREATASRAIADLTVHRLAAPPPPSQGPPARA